MNAGRPTYVDFNRFSCGNQNRDLLANPIWQRIVESLMASIEPASPRRGRANKPARRR
jgi:hypothetical protein